MPNRSQISVFLSSSMAEFEDLRPFIDKALEDRGLRVFTFERNAGARPDSPTIASLDEVERADVYVGILGRRYGPITIAEYRRAQELEKPLFIYVRTVSDRDEELEAFINAELDGPEANSSYATFSDVLGLPKRMADDVFDWLAREYRNLAALRDAHVPREELPGVEWAMDRLQGAASPRLEVAGGAEHLALRLRHWFAAFDYKVSHSMNPAGDSVDLVIGVPRKIDGVDRILVRAKGGEIAARDVNDLRAAVPEFVEAWLVSARGVESAARSAAEATKNVFTYTFDELIRQDAHYWARYDGVHSFRLTRPTPSQTVSEEELHRRLTALADWALDAPEVSLHQLEELACDLLDQSPSRLLTGRVLAAAGDVFRHLGAFDRASRRYEQALAIGGSTSSVRVAEQRWNCEARAADDALRALWRGHYDERAQVRDQQRDREDMALRELMSLTNTLGPSPERHSLVGSIHARRAARGYRPASSPRRAMQAYRAAFEATGKMDSFSGLQWAKFRLLGGLPDGGARNPVLEDVVNILTDALRLADKRGGQRSVWDRVAELDAEVVRHVLLVRVTKGEKHHLADHFGRELPTLSALGDGYLATFDHSFSAAFRNNVTRGLESWVHLLRARANRLESAARARNITSEAAKAKLDGEAKTWRTLSSAIDDEILKRIVHAP